MLINLPVTVAEYIAKRFSSEGIRYVFGVPGGPSVPYIEEFRKADIDFFLTSEEKSAGIMAAVLANLTGIPGVCHGTFGPGAANLLSGVGCALLDRAPILALTSEMPDEWLNRTAQMNINHQALFAPVTKQTFRLNAANAPELINKALSICREEYTGPVHIGLPADIAEREVSESDTAELQEANSQISGNAEEIIKILGKSRNPVIAIGLTSARLRLADPIREILKIFKAPVLLTPMAKGIIDESHPCYSGVLFHAMSSQLADILNNADLVIGIGYDQVEYNYESWLPGVPLIHFDTRFTDMPDRPEIYCLVGSPHLWFEVLGRVNVTSGIISSGILYNVRTKIEEAFSSFEQGFGPVGALKTIRDTLSPDTIVTADVGSHLHVIGQYWRTFGFQSLIMTNGWSSMGFGIPAAIAARIARPSSRVVCITGDGGFLMSAGEILTAVRSDAPVTVIVLSDGELNLIKLKQLWKGNQPLGVNLYRGDLFGAEIFLGARVLKATSRKTLKEVLETSMRTNETVIINATIDPSDYKYLVERQK